jgi:Cu(I)/Ag(I) efflux system membrane fusion protein
LRKLELLDVPASEIEDLEKTGKPHKDITLRSPISGTVLKRDAFEDQYVTAEKELYQIADLSMVWVQAKIYEYELPHVHLDQPATVTVEALPDEERSGKVVFIQPTVEESTRTVQVRVELSNKEGLLRPGMFAEIRIDHDMGEGLLVPEEAVIQTGEHTYAFRAQEGDRFMPVEVTISPLRFEEQYQVLGGLSDGDRVVTSANFLVDSESRLRFGGGMAGMAGMEMGGMKMEGRGEKGADMDGMDMKGMDMK